MRSAIGTLARKDLRLLLRDPRAVIILLAMPLIFIVVLGISLGEGFGQKPSERLRVSVCVLDQGPPRFFDRTPILREQFGRFAATPLAGNTPMGGLGFVAANHRLWFPHDSWADRLLADLDQTADLRVELIRDRAEAEELVRTGKRAAVLIIGPDFSKRVARCSFLSPGWREGLVVAATYPHAGDPIALAAAGLYDEHQSALPLYLYDGINPFFREGVDLARLDVVVLRDPTQAMAANMIDQVAQGSLLRVVMPWMIGRAFEKISDPKFLALLGNEPNVPTSVKLFLTSPLVSNDADKRNLSISLQNALQNLFPRYNLTAKTWGSLTKSVETSGGGAGTTEFAEDGVGLLRRGSARYQALVPSSLVMFAFFLVLTLGWLIVAERRQGTLKRLSLAPVSRLEFLLGKLLPCLLLSLFQGAFLLIAGKLLFDMSWGPEPAYLFLVVATTSLAAMGLAMLVAAVARTETQVAIYGTLLVLVLALMSGCLMGNRAMMPEQMQQISRVTPHAWALDAYRQLLTNPTPNLAIVWQACAALVGFATLFLGLAWASMRWE
jgi:ABC-2 type transport system permease protein